MRTNRSFICPACGESVPPNAKSCPECGACEKSGWSEDAVYDGLGDAEDDFDYDKFVTDEFGGPSKQSGKEKFWWWAAVVVVCLLGWAILHGFN